MGVTIRLLPSMIMLKKAVKPKLPDIFIAICAIGNIKDQYSKLIDDIPAPDIAISMGCDVGCPYIGKAFDDNWGLADPTGQDDEVFKTVISQIEKKILQLREDLVKV